MVHQPPTCLFLLRANFKIWSTVTQTELNNVFIWLFLQTKQHIECLVAVKRGVLVAEDPPLILWIHQHVACSWTKNKQGKPPAVFTVYIRFIWTQKAEKVCGGSQIYFNIELIHTTYILCDFNWPKVEHCKSSPTYDQSWLPNHIPCLNCSRSFAKLQTLTLFQITR